MTLSLANLTAIRSRREMRIKIAIATFGIVAVTDGVDALVNLYTQPDRLWPCFVQTTLVAAAMSLLFLWLLARSNLRLFELKERFEALALTDIQTGLLNRRGFFARLDKARTAGADLTLGVVDVDHFKPINDTEGPAFRRARGRRGVRARPERITPNDALLTGDRLRGKLSEIGAPPLPANLTVTASIGLARMGEEESMISYARADRALYDAKHSGRDVTISADLETGGHIVWRPLAPRAPSPAQAECATGR